MGPTTHTSAGESGYSLPELLVAIAIALAVAAGAMTLVIVAVKTQPRATDRSAQIQQGRTMADRITREVRQGETVFNPTASAFQVLTYVNVTTCGGAAASSAILCRVSYSCDADSCSRTEQAPNGAGGGVARVMVEGITGPDVFGYLGDPASPTYVALELNFPDSDGGESVTIADGAELRNHVALVGGA